MDNKMDNKCLLARSVIESKDSCISTYHSGTNGD